MQVSVRPGTRADIPTIVEFNAALAKESESLELDTSRLESGVSRLLADPSRGVYYMAEHEGRVVGQVMLTYEWSDWRDGLFWWIQSVYVRPGNRRQGVFAALFNHIKRAAHENPDVCGLRLYVEEHNKHAQQTYKALGLDLGGYRVMQHDWQAPATIGDDA